MREPGCGVSYPTWADAANDNPDAGLSEPLTAALRLFARTGVAAPQIASDAAEAAKAAGDAAMASRWREIGRMFNPPAISRGSASRPARKGRTTPTG